MECSSCRNPNPEGAKFCNQCGRKLASEPKRVFPTLSFEEKIEKIQRYLPIGVREKILEQRDKIEGELKQVTVVFCDMEGFSAFAERFGPEETYAVMDQVYEILIQKVNDYGGTVNELTGDGVIALFGAPIALEDAPARAIRSSYSIHREMSRFSERIKQNREETFPFKMRIGIHTGPVVVGFLGNDLRIEFKAVGDTVNLASRMESLSEPGSTYVTEETFKQTEGFFRFEALGEYAVKGKKDQVKAFRVIAPRSRRTRFDVSAERGLTPLAGRAKEIELLLDGYERVKRGQGQAFSIVSEAGVGKSRLLYEFRKAVTNEGVTFMEGKCLSYSRNIAYHPIIELIKANFDIKEGEGGFEIGKKIKIGLRILKMDEATTLPYLLELMSVKSDIGNGMYMSPEVKKGRIISAINRVSIRTSLPRPLIIAIEDLHWIDKSSEETLKALFDEISDEKIFLIFTHRPEFVPEWSGKTYHNRVILNRLSNQESQAMVTHILGRDRIGSNLEGLILEKTEGVPLFIEEFIRSLKDLKLIQKIDNTYRLSESIQEVAIPSTIQDVIMARVDSLPSGAKRLLQAGSAIEREFDFRLIREVVNLQESVLLSHLSTLKDTGLIYESGIYPETSYVFKHSLTREVVYRSILRMRKKKLHEEIGSAIEKLHKDRIADHCEGLSRHFIYSENYTKAAQYLKVAEKKAEMTAALNDAISFGRKRVTSLEKLPQTNEIQKELIDARTALSLYLAQMNYFVEAREAITSVVELAKTHGHRKLSQIYTIMGTCDYMVEENFSEALCHLEKALCISEELNDIVSMFFANFWLGIALSLNCEFNRAFNHFQKALEINKASNILWGISAIKSMINYFVYFFQGEAQLGYRTTTEALLQAEESGDIYSKAFAFYSHGLSCYCMGFLEEARLHLLKGKDFFEKINFFSFNALTHQYLGEVYFEIGDYKKSTEHYEMAVWLTGKNRFLPSLMNLNRIGAARAKIMDTAEKCDIDAMRGYVHTNKIKFHDSLMLRYIAEYLLKCDDKFMDDAEAMILHALEVNRKNGMRFFLAKDYALYAKLLARKGDRAGAGEKLSESMKTFRSCGADRWREILGTPKDTMGA
jgi:class 3 adenylate cyclase/tetratricopeptide (TPR) repeat protein